jgi:hypothetical protein
MPHFTENPRGYSQASPYNKMKPKKREKDQRRTMRELLAVIYEDLFHSFGSIPVSPRPGSSHGSGHNFAWIASFYEPRCLFLICRSPVCAFPCPFSHFRGSLPPPGRFRLAAASLTFCFRPLAQVTPKSTRRWIWDDGLLSEPDSWEGSKPLDCRFPLRVPSTKSCSGVLPRLLLVWQEGFESWHQPSDCLRSSRVIFPLSRPVSVSRALNFVSDHASIAIREGPRCHAACQCLRWQRSIITQWWR